MIPKNRNLSHKLLTLMILGFIGCLIALCPTPNGVDSRAYPMFGIFSALILGILLKPYPITVLALFGLFAAMAFHLVSVKEGLGGFGESVIWLIAFASIAAKSFTKTHLGKRLACFFIKKTGHNSLSLAYGLMFSEVALAPVIPSNTARAACISVPLSVSVSESLGSSPKDHTEGLIGRFLSLCSMHSNNLSSALFLTAMGTNPLVQRLIGNLGIQISWGEWFLMACVPGVLCLLAAPLILFKLFPPELKRIPHAAEVAQNQLASMPPFSLQETITLIVFLGMVTFWILGDVLNIPTAFVALGGLCALLFTGVLTLDDVTEAKSVWDTVIWLSILIFLAGKLAEFGLFQYYATLLQTVLSGHAWPVILITVALIYYFAHYFLPGNTMHACALFPAFSALLIACGVPAKLGCMVLAFLTSYFGFITPYATSSGPIVFSTGYISSKAWWKSGAFAGIAYLFIWGIFGSLWWKMLGYY